MGFPKWCRENLVKTHDCDLRCCYSITRPALHVAGSCEHVYTFNGIISKKEIIFN